MSKKLTTFVATDIVEGRVPVRDDEEFQEAWQVLIDTGEVYRKQGWFSQIANDLICRGLCKPNLNFLN